MTWRGLFGRAGWCGLKRVVSRAWGPRMVGGYALSDGRFLPHTRVSNCARIDGAERLSMGDHVFIGHFSVIDASNGLHIGEGCQIGFFTGLFTHSSHVAIRLYGRNYVHTPVKAAYFRAPVFIGDYTFVGAHATILPGSRIGRGVIVSAYSLVDGEVPDFAIVAGQPAKVVGDTRQLDRRHLRQHPELLASYQAWAGDGVPDRHGVVADADESPP